MKRKVDPLLAPIEQVELHPEIPEALKQAFLALNHQARADWFSIEAVAMLVQMHPIHVIQSKKAYLCMAGMRSWQLAKWILPPTHEVPLLRWRSLRQEEIERLAWADLYLSHLAFNMPGQLRQSGLAAIWNGMPDDLRKQLTPELRYATRFAQVFPGDRRKLSKQKNSIPQGK